MLGGIGALLFYVFPSGLPMVYYRAPVLRRGKESLQIPLAKPVSLGGRLGSRGKLFTHSLTPSLTHSYLYVLIYIPVYAVGGHYAETSKTYEFMGGLIIIIMLNSHKMMTEKPANSYCFEVATYSYALPTVYSCVHGTLSFAL